MSDQRIVEVVWVDTVSFHQIADQRDWPAPAEIHSIGYLLREDPSHIVIARDACLQGTTHRSLIAIPTRSILTMDELAYVPIAKEPAPHPLKPKEEPTLSPFEQVEKAGIKIETFGEKPTVTIIKPEPKKVEHRWERAWVFDAEGKGPWFDCTRCHAHADHADHRLCPGDPEGPSEACAMCGVRCWDEVPSGAAHLRQFKCASCDHSSFIGREPTDTVPRPMTDQEADSLVEVAVKSLKELEQVRSTQTPDPLPRGKADWKA